MPLKDVNGGVGRLNLLLAMCAGLMGGPGSKRVMSDAIPRSCRLHARPHVERDAARHKHQRVTSRHHDGQDAPWSHVRRATHFGITTLLTNLLVLWQRAASVWATRRSVTNWGPQPMFSARLRSASIIQATNQDTATLRLYHLENGSWIDRTISLAVESAGNLVCTNVTGLAPVTAAALGPAKIWVGLTNSDDVGIRLDFKAEVLPQRDRAGSVRPVVQRAGGQQRFQQCKTTHHPTDARRRRQLRPNDQ